MKNLLFSFLFFVVLHLFTTRLSAEQKPLSPEALNLIKQYELLKTNPTNTNIQLAYLKTFPQNRRGFKNLFDQEDFTELYRSSDQYIFVLGDLFGECRREVGLLLISITRDGAPGCCDAWSTLHKVTTDFAVKDTKSFASILSALDDVARRNVIRFIADKENHYVFRDYQVIINNLKKLREGTLAEQFESERTRRMAIKDH